MTTARRLLLLLAAALCALAGAGCLKRETAVQRGNREQILHRGIGNEVTELDPHLVTGVAEGNVLRALFEGLVAEDPVDLRPVPGVAERWEISGEGRVYTFLLRANARWTNGEPVTAQDFVASFRRILTPTLAADYANMLYILQGAEAFHKGSNPDFAQVGATALDARTLRLTLEHPAPYFLSLIANPPWFPVPLATIEKHGPAYQRGNGWTRPGRIVTNGPFALKDWQPHQKIIATKHPGYWDAATVRLNAIHFYPIDSVDAEERAFRSGQLHLTEFTPLSKIDSYLRDTPDVLRRDPYLGTYFYRFNTRRPPLNDVRVRRALALAVDREAIATKVARGGQRPAQALTPPGTAGYTAAAALATDVATARRLLAEAGFPAGRGLPAIDLLYNSSENHRAVAEALQEMWRRDLGVEVRLTNQELKVVHAARRAGDFQLLRSDWVGDYLDPATFLDIFRSDSGNNYTGWTNPEYDAALFAAARTADPAARFALFQKAEALLLDAVPLIPLYHYTHVFLLQPAVKGWHPNLLDHHPYKHVWLEK
jgi:oligopeptide transport system substrate-binding protein